MGGPYLSSSPHGGVPPAGLRLRPRAVVQADVADDGAPCRGHAAQGRAGGGAAAAAGD